MTKKTKWIIGISTAVLLFAMFSGYFYGVSQVKAKDKEISTLTTEAQTFKTITVGKNEIIGRQEQRITDLETAEKAGLINTAELKAEGVKNVQTIVALKTEIDRLKLQGNFNTPPQVIHDTITQNGTLNIQDYLKVPLGWKFTDKWTNIEGTVKTSGVVIDSLITFSEPSITLGYSRGFFQSSKPIVVFKDNNPYTKVKDMSNIVIINKPPVYKRTWFHLLEGIGIDEGLRYGIKRLSK